MGPIGNYWRLPDPVPRERWTGRELLALRAWRLVRWSEDGSVRLRSLSRDEVWHGPVFTADHVPLAAADCGSGVYAVKARCRPRTSMAFQSFDWLAGRDTWIWGWVALSGQVVEHAAGYRAQTAVVRRLHLGVQVHLYFHEPWAIARLVRELENRYQCPVKTGYWEPRKAHRIRTNLRWERDPPRTIQIIHPQPKVVSRGSAGRVAPSPAATLPPPRTMRDLPPGSRETRAGALPFASLVHALQKAAAQVLNRAK